MLEGQVTEAYREEVSPAVSWRQGDNNLLGPRQCLGAVSQVGG